MLPSNCEKMPFVKFGPLPYGIGFFLIATPLFLLPPPGWHKRGGIRISGGGIKGGGIKISDFQGVA